MGSSVNGKTKGVYVALSDSMSKKLSFITTIMPLKKDGTKWHKKELVELACTKFLNQILSFFDGVEGLDELIKKGKELDIDEIEIDTGLDMPQEDAGLKEF